jgi:hypothetical protein
MEEYYFFIFAPQLAKKYPNSFRNGTYGKCGTPLVSLSVSIAVNLT